TVSLKDARRRALACRQQRLDGLNPLTEKRRARQPAPEIMTFEAAARRYINDKKDEWRGGGAAGEWTPPLRDYVFSLIGRLSGDRAPVGCGDRHWRRDARDRPGLAAKDRDGQPCSPKGRSGAELGGS